MRIITIEEHFQSKRVEELGNHYYRSFNPTNDQLIAKLADLGEARIADMDKNGIGLQVLSHTVASPEILEAARAIPLCAHFNDELAEAVAKYPKRYAGFACLPTADPNAAARELERSVKQLGFVGAMIQGTTQGFLDSGNFSPLLASAEELDVPLYLHPAPPPETVLDAYFSGLDPRLSKMMAIAGWGWHAELALHTLRLITAGVFDRHPKLQIIIGHMGEMIPFQLARIDKVLSPFMERLQKKPSDYFQSNIYLTTSGLFTVPPTYLTLQVIGADRIIFSVDYPYSPNEVARPFLNSLSLSPTDLAKITHQNAERLLKLPRA